MPTCRVTQNSGFSFFFASCHTDHPIGSIESPFFLDFVILAPSLVESVNTYIIVLPASASCLAYRGLTAQWFLSSIFYTPSLPSFAQFYAHDRRPGPQWLDSTNYPTKSHGWQMQCSGLYLLHVMTAELCLPAIPITKQTHKVLIICIKIVTISPTNLNTIICGLLGLLPHHAS